MSNETATPEVMPGGAPETTSDDRLWAALSYIPIIAIIMLLMEEKRNRPFIKFNAVQALALAVVLFVVSIILGIIPVVGCLTPLLWLVLLWPAINAFNGKYTQIPVVSDFIRKQNWA